MHRTRLISAHDNNDQHQNQQQRKSSADDPPKINALEIGRFASAIVVVAVDAAVGDHVVGSRRNVNWTPYVFSTKQAEI